MCGRVLGEGFDRLQRIETQAPHPRYERGGFFIAWKDFRDELWNSSRCGSRMSTGGEVANALVCKTSIRGFNSRPVLQSIPR